MRYIQKFHVKALKSDLKRTLTLWQVTLCGIGIILGAGIYALIGIGAGHAGNALWLSFLIAGIIAGLTGLSYAELSSVFTKSAAEYDYIHKAFNKTLAWIVAAMMIFAALFTVATVAIGFAGYLERLTSVPVFAGAVGLVFLLTLINLWGIRESTLFNIILTLIEAGGLLFIILLGMPHWGSVSIVTMPHGFSGVLQASALVFFSFLGFESIVKLAEETKNPTKTIPKAIVFSVIFSTLIYILVSLSAVSILDWKILSASNAPLADVAGIALGGYTFLLLGLVALCSTTNTALMDMVTASRQVYGMAKRKTLPLRLSNLGKTKTPYNAILFVSILVLVFLVFQDLERLASIANFFTFSGFALVNLAVIVLRKTYPQKRSFKVPGSIFGVPIIPLLGCITSVGMLYYVFAGII